MLKVASLRYGVIFKKAFSQPPIFKAFVKDILGIDLEIDTVETEKSFDPVIGNVDSRFDLFAEDKKHRTIVDIQHARHVDHYDRFLHYHCAALLEQVANSQDYRPQLNVFTIVVLTSGDRHGVDIASIDFDPKDRHGKPLGEISHKIIYLCPKYVTDETPEPYQQWLRAIDDSLDEEVNETQYSHPEIKKIFDLIQTDQTTPQERARMKDEYSRNLLLKNEYEMGVNKGVAQGIEKGREQGMAQVALKMIADGFALEQIATLTGLSVDKLKSLDNQS